MAESDDLLSKRSINMLMEFKKDGTIVNHRKKGKPTASYSINGIVIEYTDKRGTHQWEVTSFTPDESMGLNHMGGCNVF